jgi:glycerophosphoryl diester phosphodiesterase
LTNINSIAPKEASKIMEKIVLLLFSLLLFSCSTKETIKGELSFKLVNFMPQEGFSKENAQKIEKMLDDLKSNSSKKDGNASSLVPLENLRKHHLLTSPNIRIRTSNNDIKIIYLSDSAYQKIKKYTVDYLQQNQSKLEIELGYTALEKELYYSDHIVSFNEVKGESYIEK